jgi:osmotically inducible lipoprotein OsmB
MYKSLIVMALVSTALSGCLVQNDGQRALVGGAVGALGAQALGYDPVTGAAIGVGAGALCGQAGVGICQ